MLKVIGASWFQTRVSTCIVGAVSALGILAIILGEIDKEEDDGIYSATVFWSENAGFHIDFWGQGNEMEEIPFGVGRAYYRQEIDTTGWASLEIETRIEYPDWVQAYSAGLLEGSLTWQLIYWHWQNTVQHVCENREDFCKHVRKFVEDNSEKIKDIAEERGEVDPFWHQVHLFYVQLDGLETGWNHGVKRSRQEFEISHIDFLWMNMVSDLADMEQLYNRSLDENESPFMFSTAASFASAFVKLDEETGELYAAHNSGGLYQSMLRILKRYQLGYHHTTDPKSKLVHGQIITLSSYPGVIYSQDDFYLILGDPELEDEHKLAVLGTAFNKYNRTTVASLDPDEQVLIGPRVMAANRLAKDGRFWARNLAQASSGTGSKQWLIVDYGQIAGTEMIDPVSTTTSTDNPVEKKVKSKLLAALQPKQEVTTKVPIRVKKGLLWVVDQLPGITHSADQTRILKETSFWVSSGLPCYQDTTRSSGLPPLPTQSTSQLFQQGEVDVANITTVIQLMRNNTFLSNSHLLPQNTSTHFLSPDLPPMGTIDSKILVASPVKDIEVHVINGPPDTFIDNNETNSSVDALVPFQWSKSEFANETHVGLPDIWQFDAVQPEWFWV